ncbi:MAG: IclR family transcriptional regulator [Microvirga sp.]|nr:IclR family transcriptional regulator [Microvirga sp.]
MSNSPDDSAVSPRPRRAPKDATSPEVSASAQIAAPREPGVGSVKSLMKAIVVLEAFCSHDRYLSLSDLVAITGFDKSSAQRCTRTLKELGYLEQHPKTRRYAIGRRVLDLSFAYLHSNPLIVRAAPIMVDLRQSARERVDLSILDGPDLIYVYRLQSKREALSAALVGKRVPIYSSAGGRALLACLSDEEAMTILDGSDRRQRTPTTLTDPETILAEVRRARTKGYALQVGEWRPGEIVVASAVTDHEGRPVGALHIAGSTTEWSPEDFERRMGPLVAAAAGEINHV